jgi:catechol 2,3-dioxygenase-like lactoylglutathione lyase family enzyme
MAYSKGPAAARGGSVSAQLVGIGGIFFKARDPARLGAWYREHLGLDEDTRYFDPSPAGFMINYRVEDLDGLLAAMRAAGCEVDDRIEESKYGRFGWVLDPEGNRLELWEPPVRRGA